MEGVKKLRPNKSQLRVLLEYMREHPDFAAGRFSAPNGQAQALRQWETLATLLNEHGPARNVQQWKVTWRDQKSKARIEGSAHSRAVKQTGNGPVPELSENSILVLDTIGKEMAVGMGRAETGVGLSLRDEKQNSEAGPSGLQANKAEPSGSKMIQSRKRKLVQPQFLEAQTDLNRISETQLQSLNSTLSGILAALQQISSSLITSNRLRMQQLQGHDEAPSIPIEEQEVIYEDYEELESS